MTNKDVWDHIKEDILKIYSLNVHIMLKCESLYNIFNVLIAFLAA